MRPPIAVVTLALSFAVPSIQRQQEDFSLLLEHTENSWAVECEKGCAWKASFACTVVPCDALVDSRGVVTLGEARPLDPKFQFIVRRRGEGVAAISRGGTSWTGLSWSCTMLPCRVRITQNGVALIGPGR